MIRDANTVSTAARPSIFRPAVEVAGRETLMLIDQVRSIDRDYVTEDPVDYLTGEAMARVEVALAHYLGVHAARRF